MRDSLGDVLWPGFSLLGTHDNDFQLDSSIISLFAVSKSSHRTRISEPLLAQIAAFCLTLIVPDRHFFWQERLQEHRHRPGLQGHHVFSNSSLPQIIKVKEKIC